MFHDFLFGIYSENFQKFVITLEQVGIFIYARVYSKKYVTFFEYVCSFRNIHKSFV